MSLTLSFDQVPLGAYNFSASCAKTLAISMPLSECWVWRIWSLRYHNEESKKRKVCNRGVQSEVVMPFCNGK